MRLYTDDKNVLILIALLKEHNIHRVIASPGVRNIAFVASIQQDSFFQIFSAADERSAAYIACGMAAESGEPVVITCTEATASRNYMPGLTEAFYRKLPVLAVTCTWDNEIAGNLIPQSTDRSVVPNDIVRYSTAIPVVKEKNDEWSCEYRINKAILELSRNGGGPAHLNLTLKRKREFNIEKLPEVRKIYRVSDLSDKNLPDLRGKRVAVYVGSHLKWDEESVKYVEQFCSTNNCVVLCDLTSNYPGSHKVSFPLLASQINFDKNAIKVDVLIHIGGVSGSYSRMPCDEVWRIDEDGEVKDTFKKLTYIFAMKEKSFFEYYSKKDAKTNREEEQDLSYFRRISNDIYSMIPDLPFSNIWIAKEISKRIPQNSVLHLAILNSLRSWNFFDVPESVTCYSNVGGFGIDGTVSSMIGASLVSKEKIYYLVVGDLALFYDMNVLGNRHVENNVRILFVNNGRGTEFTNYDNAGAKFGEDTDKYIAAAGHYGNKSPDLIRHYSEDLGYEYISASNKNEFNCCVDRFLTPVITEKPIIFEVFTSSEDESNALKLIHYTYPSTNKESVIKESVKQLLGEKLVNKISEIRNRK